MKASSVLDRVSSLAQRRNRSQIRNRKGQAVALPMLILALMVLVIVGLFAFEIARTAVAREQLRAATESAALAAAAALAGSASTDIVSSQNNAIAAGLDIFRKNEIFAVSLSDAAVSAPQVKPPAGKAFISFQFLDPLNNNAPVAAGDPKGKAIEVRSIYSLQSMAGKTIGLGDAPLVIESRSTGGVGQLDVVLCFDCSMSMRFNTKGTVIRRAWNEAEGKIEYISLGSTAQSVVGGMRPQFLDGLNVALRGVNDNSLPGNFPPGTASNTGFTDRVCNIDDQLNYGGISEDGFDFPSLAVLVEASRGNLENQSVFESSGAATALNGVVVPKAGYQAKYFELARKHTHPFGEAVEAAEKFFTLMNNNTRAHFGFVAFNEAVGQNESSAFQEANVANSYPASGIGNFPLPAISLAPELANSRFQEVANAVASVVPKGGTNIGGSLERACRMFDPISTVRPNTKKVIILFTDGLPSVGSPLSSGPIENCRLAAEMAKQRGIAVYSVGLALESSMQQSQSTVLNMISNTAGNGGRVFQVNNASNLNAAFAAIARNLTQIVQ